MERLTGAEALVRALAASDMWKITNRSQGDPNRRYRPQPRMNRQTYRQEGGGLG